MNNPLVSIIIPAYNRAYFLGETLDSVIAQTYQNWECIVVDDGSNDYTDELMEFYCEKDSRIQYYHRPSNKPKGANACRNYGFDVSKGEYINWLDSDDLLSRSKIRCQIEKMLSQFSELATFRWGILNRDRTINFLENLNVYRDFEDPKTFLKALYSSVGFSLLMHI